MMSLGNCEEVHLKFSTYLVTCEYCVLPSYGQVPIVLENPTDGVYYYSSE